MATSSIGKGGGSGNDNEMITGMGGGRKSQKNDAVIYVWPLCILHALWLDF